MRTSSSTTKGVLSTLMLLALLGTAIAGCGDDSDSQEPDPQIPAAVAGRLAELSDEAADELAAGDGCAAQETVDELEHQVELSRAQVPQELRAELEGGVQKLAAKIECVPEPVIEEPVPEAEPEPKPEQKEKPKEKPKEEEKEEKEEEESEDCPPGFEQQEGGGCVAKDEGGGNGNGGQGNGGNGSGGEGGTGVGGGDEGGG
jgi:outer membrane biosynthesis protein TonB